MQHIVIEYKNRNYRPFQNPGLMRIVPIFDNTGDKA